MNYTKERIYPFDENRIPWERNPDDEKFFDKLIKFSETWFINDESEDGTSSKTRCKILDGHEMVCIFMESFFDPLELCYILGEKNCDSVDEYVWEFILERYVDQEDWEWVSGYTICPDDNSDIPMN